jgi:hypothetical protein
MEHDPEKLIQEWQRGFSDSGGVPSWQPGLSDSAGVAQGQPAPPGYVPYQAPPYGPYQAPLYQAPLYGAGPIGLTLRSLRPPWFRYRFLFIIGAVYVVVIFALGIGSSLRHSWHSSGGGEVVHRGGNLSISGSSERDTLGCDGGGDLFLTGNSNTFTVTGHCASVTISGNNNHVTVDSADRIDAGGINTVVTYHSGTPTVTQSGINATVQQG